MMFRLASSSNNNQSPGSSAAAAETAGKHSKRGSSTSETSRKQQEHPQQPQSQSQQRLSLILKQAWTGATSTNRNSPPETSFAAAVTGPAKTHTTKTMPPMGFRSRSSSWKKQQTQPSPHSVQRHSSHHNARSNSPASTDSSSSTTPSSPVIAPRKPPSISPVSSPPSSSSSSSPSSSQAQVSPATKILNKDVTAHNNKPSVQQKQRQENQQRQSLNTHSRSDTLLLPERHNGNSTSNKGDLAQAMSIISHLEHENDDYRRQVGELRERILQVKQERDEYMCQLANGNSSSRELTTSTAEAQAMAQGPAEAASQLPSGSSSTNQPPTTLPSLPSPPSYELVSQEERALLKRIEKLETKNRNQKELFQTALEIKDVELSIQRRERDILAQRVEEIKQARRVAEQHQQEQRLASETEALEHLQASLNEAMEDKCAAMQKNRDLLQQVESSQLQVKSMGDMLAQQQRDSHEQMDRMATELNRQIAQLEAKAQQQEAQLRELEERGRLETTMMRQVMAERIQDYEARLQNKDTLIEHLQTPVLNGGPEWTTNNTARDTTHEPHDVLGKQHYVKEEEEDDEDDSQGQQDDQRRPPRSPSSAEQPAQEQDRAQSTDMALSSPLDLLRKTQEEQSGGESAHFALVRISGCATTTTTDSCYSSSSNNNNKVSPTRSEGHEERLQRLRSRRRSVESFMRAKVEHIRKQNLDSSSQTTTTTAAESLPGSVSA